METVDVFKRMMKEQTEIALATSVEGVPNVRIVSFFYDERMKSLFFSTFKGNEKISEFQKNPNVAFTTIPKEGAEHVRVHFGQVRKSEKTIFDVAEQWIKKIPSYEENIKQAGEMLELYEIQFKEAIVIEGMASRKTIEV